MRLSPHHCFLAYLVAVPLIGPISQSAVAQTTQTATSKDDSWRSVLSSEELKTLPSLVESHKAQLQKSIALAKSLTLSHNALFNTSNDNKIAYLSRFIPINTEQVRSKPSNIALRKKLLDRVAEREARLTVQPILRKMASARPNGDTSYAGSDQTPISTMAQSPALLGPPAIEQARGKPWASKMEKSDRDFGAGFSYPRIFQNEVDLRARGGAAALEAYKATLKKRQPELWDSINALTPRALRVDGTNRDRMDWAMLIAEYEAIAAVKSPTVVASPPPSYHQDWKTLLTPEESRALPGLLGNAIKKLESSLRNAHKYGPKRLASWKDHHNTLLGYANNTLRQRNERVQRLPNNQNVRKEWLEAVVKREALLAVTAQANKL